LSALEQVAVKFTRPWVLFFPSREPRAKDDIEELDVSSKVRRRPSCGGESLVPRIGNLTLAFSQNLIGLALGAMRWRTLFNGIAAFGVLLFIVDASRLYNDCQY
jgi:hypothetical protein